MSVRGTDSVRTRRDAASSAVGRSAWTSGKTYAVCHRMLAPAWPTSHAGGIMKILASVPNSSMVVAKGTPTTSNLKVSAQLSAKETNVFLDMTRMSWKKLQVLAPNLRLSSREPSTCSGLAASGQVLATETLAVPKPEPQNLLIPFPQTQLLLRHHDLRPLTPSPSGTLSPQLSGFKFIPV